MQQIMELASSFGAMEPNESSQSTEFPIGMIQQLSQVLQQAETQDKRQETLVQALLPYLSPGRKIRLERAMQLSHFSRLAGAAFRGKIHLSDPEEDANV